MIKYLTDKDNEQTLLSHAFEKNQTGTGCKSIGREAVEEITAGIVASDIFASREATIAR